MKASLLLVTSEKPTKQGFPIYIKLYHSGKRTRTCVGHSKAEHWDKDNSQPLTAHPDYFEFIPIILDYKAKIAKVNIGDYNLTEAQNIIFGSDKDNTTALILQFFDTRIAEKKIKKLPFQSYIDVKSIISSYIDNKDIPINDITYEWLNKFVLYKLTNGCGQGGVMSYLRTLRAVYKEAQRRESLNIKQKNPFIGVITNPTPKKVIELPKDDLKKLLQYTPKNSTTIENTFKIKRTVAIWLFQFYIGGHDYIDVSLLTWNKIKDHRVKFKRYKNRNRKNGGELVDNMLCKKALKIIEIYGTPKTERIFSFIPNPKKGNWYKSYSRNINHTLTRVSTHLEFNENIKTKSPRYIFRTIAGEKLIHDLIITKIQGHKLDGVSYRYQGVISNSVIDEAHNKIISVLK